MTASERSRKIEQACASIRATAKEKIPKPKNGIWHECIFAKQNRKILLKLISENALKFEIDKKVLIKILLK